jgi:hypothetical protein
MDFILGLKVTAALGTALTGVLALVRPTAVYGFTGLTANGVRGISEIRAIFGGLFIGLGVAAFFLGQTAYQMLGVAYLGIAVARLFSMVFDKSFAQSNIISLVIEIVFGAILIL